MICRLCLNALDEQNAVLLFGGGATEATTEEDCDAAGAGAGAGGGGAGGGQAVPESYLVQLISIHLYLCLSRDDAISTCICSECCAQLESFHNFWQLVELKQTTLCSQFLIDCDVNWSEEPDEELVTLVVEPESYIESKPAVVPMNITTTTTAAPNKFPCMFCEKSFKMRRYLEEHIATHTGDRPIPCPYCEMAFRCRSNMYTHVKSKHTTQWLKAREERDAAKSQNQASHIEARTEESAPAATPTPANAPPASTGIPAPAPPTSQQLPLSVIKSEPGEAINLTMVKSSPTVSRGSRNRASRRKTHSPKKVQPTEASDASDEDLPQKRLKENELILANYNAVAAAVVAAASLTGGGAGAAGGGGGGGGGGGASNQSDSLQQRLCVSLLQQQQFQPHDQLLAAPGSSSTSTTSNPMASYLGNPYGSPPGEAEKRTLDKRRLVPAPNPSQMEAPPVSPLICPNCGELPGQNHRCLSKPKYACDVCGKSFKMKRYLEEHFATHTGVKLHTCAFCPTEFRSKSNMYHHTKRKHKAEWERSRASRSAAKEQRVQQEQEQLQHQLQLQALPSAQSGPAAV
ncbi:hypothetical protein KR009_011284 [Drosophila setifemur]|nr:hypothetical protein KR009_011284 [Drosophila setifemur]